MKWIHYWILLLANPWIRYGFLTFVATFVSLVVKLASRPDQYRLQLEDIAVGFDLAQVAIFAILTDGVADVVRVIVKEGRTIFDLATVEKLVTIPSVLFAMTIFLFSLALLVRKRGWTQVAGNFTLNRFGFFGPMCAGLLYLVVAVVFLGW